MHKYSVEVSHYIVTYYKDTKKNPDTGETEVERKQSHTPLTNLDWTKGFDNFIEENRWVDSEIVDILDKVWKALPGKHVYLSKSTSHAILDIKLSNHGFPKTIYRVIYKHHRNELGDYLKDYADKIGAYDNEKPENVEDKKLPTYEPIHIPVSDEAKSLIDQINTIRSKFRIELEALYQDGLISRIGTRRALSFFSKICTSVRLRMCTNDNGQSFKRITEAYEGLQKSLENVDFTISPVFTHSEHFDTINEIVDKMYNLLWDVRTDDGQTNLAYTTAAIESMNYLRDYTYYLISLKLSDAPVEAYPRTDC